MAKHVSETPATAFLKKQGVAYTEHMYEYEEHGGTAVSARELGVPVVPVVIDGAHAVLPAGRRLPKFLRRISITYLDAVRPAADEPLATFNARVRTLIQEALEPAGARAGA